MRFGREWRSDEKFIRRAFVLLALAAVAIAAIVALLSLGSSDSKPAYSLGDSGGPSSVVGAVDGGPRRPGRRPAQAAPAPAAVALARTLPIEQQVSQLFIVGVQGTTASGASSPNWGGFVVGSSNFESDSQLSALASGLSTTGSAGLSPLIAAAQVGGPDTAFPDLPPESQAVVGGSAQPAVARAQAVLAAKRLQALGFNMNLAPFADVDTPGGPLSGRLFSTDPATVGRFSLEAIHGYKSAKMISAVGHFPGSGGASGDPDQMTATVGGTLDALRARDLVPFETVAPAAPVIVMSNALYAAFDGVTPAGLLPRAVHVLRTEYRFGGVVMSGDLDATLQATGQDAGTVAVRALTAGDDLLFITGSLDEQRAAYGAVLAAAQRDAGVRARVHKALLRVLTLKARYKLLR